MVGLLELFGVVGNVVLIEVVFQRVLDSLFCQYGAVNLVSGQTVQCLADGLIGQLQGLVNGFAEPQPKVSNLTSTRMSFSIFR